MGQEVAEMRPTCGGNFQIEQAWRRQPGHSSAARGNHREPTGGWLDGLAGLISKSMILVHENCCARLRYGWVEWVGWVERAVGAFHCSLDQILRAEQPSTGRSLLSLKVSCQPSCE